MTVEKDLTTEKMRVFPFISCITGGLKQFSNQYEVGNGFITIFWCNIKYGHDFSLFFLV